MSRVKLDSVVNVHAVEELRRRSKYVSYLFFCKQGAKNCSLSAHDAITCNQASYPHIYLQKWSQR